MKLFPWQKKTEFFTPEEKQQLLEAIQKAELRTSGEVRLFVESKCRFMDAGDRAFELFAQLQMHQTELRNATLIYVAVKDRQAAVYGDEGIHKKVGQQYWQDVVAKMLLQFRQEKLADGICQGIHDLGEALTYYFPYDKETDKNELPDEIIFGK
ncbi:MAG TPA: TPM domain-containing protein [Flavisolibacter sp.]|nr:TPM domain-containing protein [Flavisolibacter sp.]